MEKILRNIIEGVSNNHGSAFFETICLKLHESIGADFTFIARLDIDAYVSRTIALVAGGELVDNMEYSLEHTPCADVADDSVCLYPENIIPLFPQDQLLIDMGIEGYVGTPLHDSVGNVMGLTVALYKQPIKDVELTRTVFEIFSGRIAAEIERTEYQQHLEEKIHERTQHLEDAMDNLKHTQSQLVQQEKLASLGGVVAGVAHEINTPLGIAKTGNSLHEDKLNALQTAFMDKQLTESFMTQYLLDAQEISKAVSTNLERAIDLVQHFKLAAVDRIDDAIHKHNLFEMASHIERSLEPEFQRSQITCSINIDKKIELDTHGSDLSLVLNNLIMNACIHAFEGKNNGIIEMIAIEKDGHIEIDIKDNGCGVKAEIREKVFDPFVTSKRNQGGTGLGMNIVHNHITNKLGGSIELIDPKEGGTQWHIVLPKTLQEDAA